jgi:hypothetical protein
MVRVRKTYQEKLESTPAQERELARRAYPVALSHALQHRPGGREQRISLWRQRGVSLTRSAQEQEQDQDQEAELTDLRSALPEDGTLPAHVLQDVLARLDKTDQAVFRRSAPGEKAGFPRLQGNERSHSFTYKQASRQRRPAG